MDNDTTTTAKENDDHTPAGEHRGGAAEDAYAQTWQQARAESVRVLTSAARLTHPSGGPVDFADFLAEVLASVTANLGSIERVLAGRLGSWEADLVAQLVFGTVGPDPAYLIGRRTEPVVIHLNVARLVEAYGSDHRDLPWAEEGSPCDHELSDLYARHYHELDGAHRDQDGHLDDETIFAAHEAQIAAVTTAWQARYTAYAQAFTTGVTTEAATIPELTVPVTVEAITDPDALTDGPDHPEVPALTYNADALTWRLWTAGLAAAGPIPGTTPPTGDGDDH